LQGWPSKPDLADEELGALQRRLALDMGAKD
jgi:hypothetical protein